MTGYSGHEVKHLDVSAGQTKRIYEHRALERPQPRIFRDSKKFILHLWRSLRNCAGIATPPTAPPRCVRKVPQVEGTGKSGSLGLSRWGILKKIHRRKLRSQCSVAYIAMHSLHSFLPPFLPDWLWWLHLWSETSLRCAPLLCIRLMQPHGFHG